MQNLAIIGSGISGLGCAWFLHRDYHITVFEGGSHVGGHTHTVAVQEDDHAVPIDTGFMVFNHVTYPNLVRLFAALNVTTTPTDMSFSVQHAARKFEFCGSSVNHLFAQRRNLLRPSFYRLLFQIDRFNREAVAAINEPAVQAMTLADYVERGNYGRDFLTLYLVPMSSAVWSTPPHEMLQFPALTLLRFFHNHGFLGLHTQHPWRTVAGGAQSYVEKMCRPFRDRIHLDTPVRNVRRTPAGVAVSTEGGTQHFDKVIFACHPPTALSLLNGDTSPAERTLLSAFRFQANTVTLHTDESVMPQTRRAWSAWNYRLDATLGAGASTSTNSATHANASIHYWMNRLQNVSPSTNYFVSVNGSSLISPRQVRRTIPCEHPLFDLEARDAQAGIPALNAAAVKGTETYFAGAWQRYGFHEDGLFSAVKVSELLLGRDPWASAT